MKKRPIYCWKCRRTTPHSYVGKKSDYEGMGIARAYMAVISLGMTETTWADKYWQCDCCGDIARRVSEC